MPKSPRPARFLLLATAMAALLGAMWSGLIRLGFAIPLLQPALVPGHGPLMISGFLGTLIGLERAVAVGHRWTFAAPALTGLGALCIIFGQPAVGAAMLTAGSAIFAVVVIRLAYQHPATFTIVMALGGPALLVGNLLWLSGRPTATAVPWWAAYLVLTIAAERLELSRVLLPPPGAMRLFVGLVALYGGGVAFTLVNHDLGVRLTGVGLLGLTAWLFRHDIARRTVRQSGLTRFIAFCLLSGYLWLGVSGILSIWFGGVTAGLQYDAILHAVFLGFVITMIFGHAPVIFPAVLGLAVPYRPRFYAHLGLLHLSLLLRILIGDLGAWHTARQWGGLLNVTAILLFLANTALAHRMAPAVPVNDQPQPASNVLVRSGKATTRVQ